MTSQLDRKIDSLSQAQLSGLVKMLASRSDDAKKQAELFVAAHDPKQAAKLISKSITAFKSWIKRADFYKSSEASNRLGEILTQIERYLLRSAPDEAVKLLKRLIEFDQQIFDHIDDSYGALSSEYTIAFELLDKAFAASTEAPEAIAQYYVETYTHDPYGNRSYLTDYIKQSLQGERAKALKSAIDSAELPEAYQRESLMLCYADLIKDVDLFIEVKRQSQLPISLNDACEIAKRLNNKFRAEEAIKWLKEAPSKRHEICAVAEKIDLLEEAYRLEGDNQNAKQTLWSAFEESLSPDYYIRYLKYCDDTEKVSTKEKALLAAKQKNDLSLAINFLSDINEWALVSQLIVERQNELDGSDYSLYRKVSKHLAQSGFPLAAVLLRRVIINEILDAARAKVYQYAVSDLKLSNQFSEQVSDWQGFQTQHQFMEKLKADHWRKHKFWALLEEQIL